MAQRFGRNQRRRSRDEIADLKRRIKAQVEITRLVAEQLAACRYALADARKALLHGRDDFPARAIGAEGPFRDDVPLDTAIRVVMPMSPIQPAVNLPARLRDFPVGWSDVILKPV